jgi:hypothetical protein
MQSVAKQCKAKQSNTKQCIAQQCKAIQSKCGFGVEEPGSGASRNPGGGPVPQGTRGALIIYISVTGPVAGTCSLHGMKFVFFGGVWGCVSMDCGLRCVVFSGVLAGMWIVDCGFFWGLGWNVDCGFFWGHAQRKYRWTGHWPRNSYFFSLRNVTPATHQSKDA